MLSAAGAQLSVAPTVEAEQEENPAQGKAHRAGNRAVKNNSAESPGGSDSRRPQVKVNKLQHAMQFNKDTKLQQTMENITLP